jgi:xanthine dehydrogenase YagR molybdenum-binding subunit
VSVGSRWFALGSRAVGALARLLPDGRPDRLSTEEGEIGRPLDRVDGAQKVAGSVRYTAEHQVPNMAYAAVVGSTIARGRIVGIDASRAEGAAGVLLVMTHRNAPRMKRTAAYATLRGPLAGAAMSLPILNTDEIFWNGQPVAVVVAETQEQADHAATLVEVAYEPRPAAQSMRAGAAFTPTHALFEEAETKRGDTATALRGAAASVDNAYATPPVHHCAMEPHATLAFWEDGDLTVYDTSQYPYGVKTMLARKFGLPKRRVHVLAPFIGGGFGGKGYAWPHVSLAVAAAKLARRPVKLALSRAATFAMTGGRSPTESRVALGADAAGRLVALEHEALSMCTRDRFAEPAIAPLRHLYGCPNLRLHQLVVRLDRIQNGFFRGPGMAPGSFALESAMDELAWKLGVDPLQLRLRNEPDRHPTSGLPFTSRHLREAYQLGADAFGWRERAAAPRATRDGRWLIGQGMAAAINPEIMAAATVRLRLAADGTVTIVSGTNELGAGTSTAQCQAAAQRLGLPVGRVRFVQGDPDVAPARIPGASAATTTIASAIWAARDALVRELLALARGTDSPLAGRRPGEVETRDGGVFVKGDPGRGERYERILSRAGRETLEVTGRSAPPVQALKRTAATYGAHFCEVRVDEDTGEVRVTRWVGAFDGGRIVNPKQARSQMKGGIVMGIGMALMEETLFDERTGRVVGPSLAEYHVPTHADVPEVEVRFVNRPDPHTPLGAKGIGELGIVGVAAAVANSVYHATGTRVRELPITPDKLL